MLAIITVLVYIAGCSAPQAEDTTTEAGDSGETAAEATGVGTVDDITEGLGEVDDLEEELGEEEFDDILDDLDVLDDI